MDYEKFRREYTAGGLSAEQLDANPLVQFKRWMEQAISAGVPDPTAMVLATSDTTFGLWQRIVLCKGVDEVGFSFFTNYESNKACAIQAQPAVSLLFPWNAIDRQVMVAGSARKLDESTAAAYFASRPRGSQIAAWASRQSQPVQGREALKEAVERVTREFEGGEVPLPPFWGGFIVVPEAVEFWQGRESRLHDRFRYVRAGNGQWDLTQLQP